MPRGASLRSVVLGRTSAHRNHCNWTGPGCTTHLHSFRRSWLTTCSNLEQVRVWLWVLESVPESAAVPESAEVLESVQPLSALELARRAEP